MALHCAREKLSETPSLQATVSLVGAPRDVCTDAGGSFSEQTQETDQGTLREHRPCAIDLAEVSLAGTWRLDDVRKVPTPAWIRRNRRAQAGPLACPEQDEELWARKLGLSAVPPPPVFQPQPPRCRGAGGAKLVISLGTLGHPFSCNTVCEDEQCEAGVACPKCHLCGAMAEAEAEPQSAGPPPQSVYSVGSIGHPVMCADACKFHAKPRGCKDGAMCVRCHLCHWSRYQKGTRGA